MNARKAKCQARSTRSWLSTILKQWDFGNVYFGKKHVFSGFFAVFFWWEPNSAPSGNGVPMISLRHNPRASKLVLGCDAY